MIRQKDSRKKGLFIAFEGPEGCGKSTQIKLFIEYLEGLGMPCLLTREPGGTPIGESIRNILLDPGNKAMSPITEAYLYAASRAQHVQEKLLPHMEKGINVISDRFVDSSLIYQGVGRALGMERVMKVNLEALSGMLPDLSFVLMVRPEIGLARAKAISNSEGYEGGDRLEQEKKAFHNKIFKGFKTLPDFRDNVVLVDGERPVDTVQEEIISIFEERLGV